MRPAMLQTQPFQLRRTVDGPGCYPVSIQLQLVEALDKRSVTLQHDIQILTQATYSERAASSGNKRKREAELEQSVVVSFVTQEVHYERSETKTDVEGKRPV